MLTTNDLSDLNEYLEENHKRNREYDIRNISKMARHFDATTNGYYFIAFHVVYLIVSIQ
jgi:hypothetical protein